jgi:hypothetical protein
MSKTKLLYLLQNQDKYFLGKQNEWVDGLDHRELFKTPHRDIAVNHLFEINAHDYTQRIHLLDCEVQGHNIPIIDPAIMPPPLPKKARPEQADDGQSESSAPAEMELDSDNLSSEMVEPGEELLVHEV